MDRIHYLPIYNQVNYPELGLEHHIKCFIITICTQLDSINLYIFVFSVVDAKNLIHVHYCKFTLKAEIPHLFEEFSKKLATFHRQIKYGKYQLPTIMMNGDDDIHTFFVLTNRSSGENIFREISSTCQ